MAMELLLTGMCEGCTYGDFKVHTETVGLYSENKLVNHVSTNIVLCSHYNLCKRLHDKLAKDAQSEIDEIYDILLEHGQHDHNFKLGETIKYSPLEIKEILSNEWIHLGVKEDEK